MLVKQVHAQMLGPESWASKCTYTTSDGQKVATIKGIECLLANVLSVAITLIGITGFVMMIVGAFRYLLSGGNSKETETARKTLTFAVIGLVVALSSYIILNLIAEFTGIETILNFSIDTN